MRFNTKTYIPIFITFLFLPHFALAQANQDVLLQEVRANMQHAFKDEAACTKLYERVKNANDPEPVLLGYIGAVYIARSRFIPLLDKRESLKIGEEKLEASIKQAVNNVELIFLRLTIQLNLPSFLGYNENIEDDKKFLINNYRKATPALKSKIIKFVKESDDFTDSEKAKFTE
ncbi:MAG TPA: hypothetical protein PKD91_08280 [Bacteroidia bacterium]|nr:hypothetical protein [Bacteroidia bacterium]